MAKLTSRRTTEPNPSYQFQVGDLIEYRPGDGCVYSGRIVRPYGQFAVYDDGAFSGNKTGYAVAIDGDADPVPTFALVGGLRLRADLAAARECNAFQMMLAGIMSAPRRGRPPKSPYPPAHAPGAGEASHG